MLIDEPYPKHPTKQVLSADATLSIIAEAWPRLPKAIKARILAMVRATYHRAAASPASRYDVARTTPRTSGSANPAAILRNVYCPTCSVETWDDGINPGGACDVCHRRCHTCSKWIYSALISRLGQPRIVH